jgi:hypothetical protein
MQNGIVVVLTEPDRIETRCLSSFTLSKGLLKGRLCLEGTQPELYSTIQCSSVFVGVKMKARAFFDLLYATYRLS